jgi:hypothetical protein
MITAACHCGAAVLTAPAAPTEVTECTCSICRRLAARWAYYTPAEVGLPAPATTQVYVWGDRMLAFHRCKACGVTTHWQSLNGARDRMAINTRLVDGLDWSTIRIRQFDGGQTWRYLDEV